MKSSYRVGELAAYLGVSGDTLRLYDEKKILSPKKDANGYRRYSREDMVFLEYVIYLRKLGVPLRDIKQLVDEGSVARVEEVLQTQSGILLQRINDLNALYRETQDYLSVLQSTQAFLDRKVVSTSPRMLLRDINGSSIDAAKAFSPLENAGTPRFCIICDKDSFLSESCEQDVYIYERRCRSLKNVMAVVDWDGSIAIPEELEGKFRVLPPHKCIITAIRCRARVDYEGYMELRRYIIANNYTMVGDMVTLVVSVRNGRHEEDYYLVWAPVL